MSAHLLVAGPVEAALTAGVVRYLLRTDPSLVAHRISPSMADRRGVPGPRRPVLALRRAWIVLAVMVALTPLGLLAPGRAFGEARPAELDLARYHLDAVPRGLASYAGFWHNALFDGYDFTGDRSPMLGYLGSALVGVAALGMVFIFLSMLARSRRGRRRHRGGADAPGDGGAVGPVWS